MQVIFHKMTALKSLLHIEENLAVGVENNSEDILNNLTQDDANVKNIENKKDQLMETFGGATTTDNNNGEPLNAPRGMKQIIPLNQ
jgi:hypothetical protein